MKRIYKYPSETVSISFKTAFYIVIGVHLFGALLYYAMSHNKTPSNKQQAVVAVKRGPISDALNNNWPKKPEAPKQAVAVSLKQTIQQPKSVAVVQLHPQPAEYTLAPGDNFYTVSKKLGVSFNDLAKYNNIHDVRALRVGQVIKVPQKS
jgi:LysM repeat protein